MISETERAYLAGIIDGEGSIMLIHQPARAASGHKWEYWVLRISIANTDKRLINWIMERFGGGYSMARNTRPNQRDAYQWRIDSARAKPILEAAYPYLVLKREQADIAFEMLSTYKLVGRRGHPPEVIAHRRALTDRMKTLNKRGVA